MNEGGGESQGLFGRIKEKLIRSKRQTAAEGRHITGKTDLAHVRRLPPGQNLVTKWPVLDLGVQPDVPKAEWRLHVTGLVANPVTWSFDDFMALPQSHFKSDIHCVDMEPLRQSLGRRFRANHPRSRAAASGSPARDLPFLRWLHHKYPP